MYFSPILEKGGGPEPLNCVATDRCGDRWSQLRRLQRNSCHEVVSPRSPRALLHGSGLPEAPNGAGRCPSITGESRIPTPCWTKDSQTLPPTNEWPVRFIIEPADVATVHDVRAQANRLWAERHGPPDGPGAIIRHIGGNLSWAIRRRSSLRRLRLHAPAVERKARGQLLTMQIHLWIQAQTQARAEIRLARLLEGFAAYASWRNWLRDHRPWCGRRFDRSFAVERSWPERAVRGEPRRGLCPDGPGAA